MLQPHKDALALICVQAIKAGNKISFCGDDPNHLVDKNFEEMADSELFDVMAWTHRANPARCNAADKFYVQRRRLREPNYRLGVYAN